MAIKLKPTQDEPRAIKIVVMDDDAGVVDGGVPVDEVEIGSVSIIHNGSELWIRVTRIDESLFGSVEMIVI